MLKYDVNNINNEENDGSLKKQKLRKTFYKLPTVSYRMKNKNYIPNGSNINNGNISNSNVNNMNTNNMDMSMNNMNMRNMNNINNMDAMNNMNNIANNNMNNINNMNSMTMDSMNNINNKVLTKRLNDDYNLIIRQQPAYARCSNFNDKERRPIDPPPIIQLIFGNEYVDDSSTNSKTLLHTPFFFMSANLVKGSDSCQNEEEKDNPKSLEIVESNGKMIKATNGLTVASLTRMKDFDSTYGAFFIFHDMSVCVEGTYRLKFSLYEISGNGKRLFFRKSILSDNFKVLSAREFPGMQESSPLVKLFAEQGLKIRIRKDKSLGKHPSKRIFVDLPGYDCYEKKTTYIYVGKFPRSKEAERNNSKSDRAFENETKKIMNRNHNDYIKDSNYQNPNSSNNMYNKYIPKQDNYYHNYDYNNGSMRGPMGDYRDMDGNKMNPPMMENRNKMSMRNYINNEDMNLNQYSNNHNYRIMPPGNNHSNMNEPDINKNNNMPPYYEDSQYPFYPEDKIKLKDSNQYTNDPHFPNINNRRDDYNPSLNSNNYNKINDYPNMMPIRSVSNYPEPPLDPYMNNFDNKKMYSDRGNNFIRNIKTEQHKENEPMEGPTSNMDRNEYYQHIPTMRNSTNDENERFKNIKMEDGRRMSNSMYENKPEGNIPSFGYSDVPMGNGYGRKRKLNSLDNSYILPNSNFYDDIKRSQYTHNPPRKFSLENDMGRIPQKIGIMRIS
ncbi:hypothetical protein LY90DRAFT_223018 [Neocallimastix californiae]|uniref:Velvet domain-containing protein n=1 Tax=Neocallimastix californiae TaxID=1754190 RepID=A0A1Y2E5C4_9FUNG|nr:hypothetical protein LY90DRAFT_223018 [Neocallimastix californiae]|eukprot:ORY66768.1 hypothetical protein LY90DRAFT_223018 [Neocallimastix californiae]